MSEPSASQISLPLLWKTDKQTNHFIVTAANAHLTESLDLADGWSNHTAILIGEPRAGKTLFAHLFAERTGGEAIDDADQQSDEKLFNAWNRAQETKLPLLLVSANPLSEWEIELPDLRSRLASSQQLELGGPDDAMIAALLRQYFSERGSSISEDVLDYICKRAGRSYAGVEALGEAIHKAALEAKKPIGRKLVSSVIELQELPANEGGSNPTEPTKS